MDKTSTKALEHEILKALEAHGPMIGKELVEVFPDLPPISMWQACFQSQTMSVSHFASYYLRYDIGRADQVRLSPSILRDFLSFTLFGLPSQREQMVERQATLANSHREMSREKIMVAQQVASNVLLELGGLDGDKVCIFVAGDLSYFLAHNEPREHEASGEMVRGSDIDVIIVHDGLDEDAVERIEREMKAMKSFYLKHPRYRHELDYICKPISKMLHQLHYIDIHDKIASKIAYESLFLGGSLALYTSIREKMQTNGVDELIELDFEHALKDRKNATRALMAKASDEMDDETRSLFFFSQERVEFT